MLDMIFVCVKSVDFFTLRSDWRFVLQEGVFLVSGERCHISKVAFELCHRRSYTYC